MKALEVEVWVHPRARREALQPSEAGENPRRWEAWTPEPPHEGRANEAVRRLLAKAFGLSPVYVELLRGRTSRRKVFRVRFP